MRKIIGAGAAVLLLTACGSEQDAATETGDGGTIETRAGSDGVETRITGADGEEVTINAGSGSDVSLPDGYSIYPGAEVVTSTSLARDGGSGAIIIMNTSDSPEDVVEYYREQAEAAGVEILMDMNANGAIMVGGETEDGSRVFSINASPNGDGTTAHLQVGDNITD